MGDRFEHEWQHDGPSWIAGSGTCRHCSQSDESEGSRDECPVRLRTEVERMRAAYRSALDAMHAVGQRGLAERGALCSVLAQDVDPTEPGSAAILLDRVLQTVAEVERLRARVAELEARPTVHPLAWAYLTERHKLTQEANSLLGLGRAINEDGTRSPYTAASDHYMDSEQAAILADAMAAWDEEGCPLTATGGEVLAPGEEQ